MDRDTLLALLVVSIVAILLLLRARGQDRANARAHAGPRAGVIRAYRELKQHMIASQGAADRTTVMKFHQAAFEARSHCSPQLADLMNAYFQVCLKLADHFAAHGSSDQPDNRVDVGELMTKEGQLRSKIDRLLVRNTGKN